MDRGIGRIWLAVAAAGACASAAVAQGLVPRSELPGLTRVDEMHADVGPLSTSSWRPPADLRMPTGFEGVYRFERMGPRGQRETMFARIDGGVAAVFPRSVYVPSSGGLVPEVPAGTVFVIGGIGALGIVPAARPPSRSPNAFDARAKAPGPVPVPTSETARIEPQSIWNSEYLRQSRVEALLRSVPPR